MADFIINANGPRNDIRYLGQNGTDDTCTVNIGPDFSGQIFISSQDTDGEIETVTFNLPEGWRLTVDSFDEFSVEDPTFKQAAYSVVNADGSVAGTVSIYSNIINGAPCFAAGTQILTPAGHRAIEDLCAGDLVVTSDHGPQPLRWIGKTRVEAARLTAMPHLRPIRIRAGALGIGLPSTDLLVSPQHRVLVRSSIARKMFSTSEVLVAAKQLLQLDGFEIADDVDTVDYFHLLFDQHEVVFSNGAETEALYTGPQAMRTLGRAARSEILTLFPELADQGFVPDAARMLPLGRLGRKLASRHLRNQHPLVM